MRIFGPKRHEMAGDWRKLRDEELHDLYVSPNIIRVINSRRMRRAGHVAGMEDMRNAYKILVGDPEGRNAADDRGVDRRIILEWMLGKYGGKV